MDLYLCGFICGSYTFPGFEAHDVTNCHLGMRDSDSYVLGLELPSNPCRQFQRAPIRQEQEGQPHYLGIVVWVVYGLHSWVS